MRRILVTLCLVILPSTSALAIEECCNIVSVDPAKNSVVVREIATGKTKTLKISNTQLFEQLRPGMVFGPEAISGIPTAPRVFEPDWLDDCCDFRATLPIPVTAMAHRIEDCCKVIHVDKERGIVTVIDNDTGESLQFSMSDEERQGILDVGSSKIFDVGSKVGRSFSPLEWPPSGLRIGDRFDFPSITATSRSAQGMTVDLGSGVTITLQSLKRLGSRVVRLDFNIRNDTGDTIFLPNYGLLGSYHHSLRDVSMMDYDGGLRYGALVDSEDVCACSRGGSVERIGAGQETSYWVQLKAPPEDVGAISIDFSGGASIDNVPIAP